MANEKNLIPFDERTESEQREIRAKGGKASGAARRRKKTMRQATSMLLGMEVPDSGSLSKMLKNRLDAFGYRVEDATFQDILLASVLLKALKGDVRAAEFIRDTVGENPSLAMKKQELQLRKSELKFKQEQETKRLERTAAGGKMDEADGGLEETIHIYLPDNGRLGGE